MTPRSRCTAVVAAASPWSSRWRPAGSTCRLLDLRRQRPGSVGGRRRSRSQRVRLRRFRPAGQRRPRQDRTPGGHGGQRRLGQVQEREELRRGLGDGQRGGQGAGERGRRPDRGLLHRPLRSPAGFDTGGYSEDINWSRTTASRTRGPSTPSRSTPPAVGSSRSRPRPAGGRPQRPSPWTFFKPTDPRSPVSTFVNAVISGIGFGSLYGLVALGLVVIFKSTGSSTSPPAR